jgi:hypothetical protein
MNMLERKDMHNWFKGFNFIGYLKKHFMLGQIDPWRKTEDGKPIYTLLVTTDAALEECKQWSNQDISKKEFTDYLKLNDIYLFHNIDEFKKTKENLEKGIKEEEIQLQPKKKPITEERRLFLQKQAEKMRLKKQEKSATCES